MEHSFEEIRGVALDILAGRERVPYPATQYQHLNIGVAYVLRQRETPASMQSRSRDDAPLDRADAEIFLEVFWALFREGIISLGLNDSNREFPHFHVTDLGKRIASGENTYFFHDVSTYTKQIKDTVPNIHPTTLIYLQEAMQAFKADCLLSATVMLGVAAEHTFLLLLESTQKNEPWKSRFQNSIEQTTILRKINKFKNILDNHIRDVDQDLREDLDTNFVGILSVVRNYRNESGHPTGRLISREQVYVLLNLFITYCKRMYELTGFFSK